MTRPMTEQYTGEKTVTYQVQMGRWPLCVQILTLLILYDIDVAGQYHKPLGRSRNLGPGSSEVQETQLMCRTQRLGVRSAYRGDKFNPRVVHTLFPDAQSEYFGHFVSNQGSGHQVLLYVNDRYVKPLFYLSSELTKLLRLLQAKSQQMTLQLI